MRHVSAAPRMSKYLSVSCDWAVVDVVAVVGVVEDPAAAKADVAERDVSRRRVAASGDFMVGFGGLIYV